MERIKNQKGFTLVEVLFSLSISLLIIFSITSILRITKGKEEMKNINSNLEIGIKSLSQDLYTGSDFIYGKTLVYNDSSGNKNFISLHNRRIVREPGFVIYCHDIDEISFYKQANKIYISIVQDQTIRKFLIGIDTNEST